MNPRPIVVFDTQVILRAMLNPRSLPAKVFFEHGHQYFLALSPATRQELQNVLLRPRLRAKYPTLTPMLIERVMSILDAGLFVHPVDIPSVSRDPKDDIFLATARLSEAQYLVTEDQDLLVLHPYGTLQIINVLKFWTILNQNLEG